MGGLIYRMRGGWPNWPRPLEQMLFCSILLAVMALGGVNVYVALAAYALSVAASLRGHGDSMDLGFTDKENPEWYDFLFSKYRSKISAYWYDVIGMAVSGLAITVLPGLALSFYSLPLGLAVVVSGALKAPAYMAGWKLHPNYYDGKLKLRLGKLTFENATEIGEFFTGFLIWGSLAAVMAAIWH
jgi:hypothetical protein